MVFGFSEAVVTRFWNTESRKYRPILIFCYTSRFNDIFCIAAKIYLARYWNLGYWKEKIKKKIYQKNINEVRYTIEYKNIEEGKRPKRIVNQLKTI